MFAPLEQENRELETDEAAADWWPKARCNDGAATMTSLFFSEELHDIARAKAICSKCTVRTPCLDGALARREPWGVWGGELLLNGKILANKRKRGRPPKNPRPELVVEEVPIPPHLLPAGEAMTA